MSTKSVTRSIRFDVRANAELESLAKGAGMTVSGYIRWVVAEVSLRESRIAGNRRAKALFAQLPQLSDPDVARAEMWEIDPQYRQSRHQHSEGLKNGDRPESQWGRGL